MAGGGLIFTIVLVLISMHISQGGQVDNLVQIIALPQLGKIGQDSVSSTANVMSSAYTDIRAYIDSVRNGFGLPELPPFVFFERFPLALASKSNSPVPVSSSVVSEQLADK
ncbi:hypothetical protein KM043_013103 [Ampulex compressa]|nr:hypothetical protein KM043_013103 [Ampulex compressa]